MIIRADAPSQAHLQGTQSRLTKPKLAKEPALFPRFRDTLCCGGHILLIQYTMTKCEHITGGGWYAGRRCNNELHIAIR